MGIYSIRSSDGRGLRRITSNPGGHDSPSDYSPDGRRIVFTRFDPSRPDRSNEALFVVNVDGTGLRQITPWGLGNDEAGGSWSPDGDWIVFTGPDNPRDSRAIALYKVHPDGSALAKIPVIIGGVKVQVFGGASWSPDGSRIAFALSTGGPPGSSVEGIFVANADGSDVQQVTNAPIFDAHPDWGSHPLGP